MSDKRHYRVPIRPIDALEKARLAELDRRAVIGATETSSTEEGVNGMDPFEVLLHSVHGAFPQPELNDGGYIENIEVLETELTAGKDRRALNMHSKWLASRGRDAIRNIAEQRLAGLAVKDRASRRKGMKTERTPGQLDPIVGDYQKLKKRSRSFTRRSRGGRESTSVNGAE